jgi:2,5-diamino-6-(ribosylamino)-4(3H)-pyrimidinone 5'-phosphate reductase
MKKLEARSLKSELPFVLINMAMTADGKIATANRAVSSFGSARDREHLLELRATADAVMAGARTVDSGKITLGPGADKFRRLRMKSGLAECNLRVVVSGTGSLNPRADVFKKHFSPVIVLTAATASKAKLRQLRAVADEVKVFGRRDIAMRGALRWLKAKWGVKRLLCEGGGALNEALFRSGLVDELHLTICPKIFGGRDAPTIADGERFRRLAGAASLSLHSFHRIGDEAFVIFRRRPTVN